MKLILNERINVVLVVYDGGHRQGRGRLLRNVREPFVNLSAEKHIACGR